MIATTGLKCLRIDCIVGVLAHERERPQEIEIDVELDYDIATAARSEALDDAVDYARVAEEVTELVQQRQFRLIETLAEETTALLLARNPSVQAVRLEIRKPDAVASADCSFVRLERQRR